MLRYRQRKATDPVGFRSRLEERYYRLSGDLLERVRQSDRPDTGLERWQRRYGDLRYGQRGEECDE